MRLRGASNEVYCTAPDKLQHLDGAGAELAGELVLDRPEQSGVEVCQALKADERTRDIPILMLTAWPQLEAAARAAGCDRFLVKPVPISTLWHEVEALIGRCTAC